MAENKTLKIIPPLQNPDEVAHRTQLALAIQMLMDGRSNNIGSVTLTNGTAATVISDRRLGPSSVILMTPITANAANLVRTSDVYISNRTDESATVTHGNTANSDQDFIYIVVGS